MSLRAIGFWIGAAVLVTAFLPVVVSDEVHEAWVTRYDGPVATSDWALAVVADTEGNLLALNLESVPGIRDAEILRVTPAGGVEVLVPELGRNIDPTFYPRGISVDADGNVCVTGSVRLDPNNDSTETAFLTVKFDPDGSELWRRQLDFEEEDGLGNFDDDVPTAITTDPTGNVYVTGATRGEIGGFFVSTTVKYSASGEELWVRGLWPFVTGEPFPSTATGSIIIDGNGDVLVVAGKSLLEKYDGDGNLQWQAQPNPQFYSPAVALDPEGNVYITGPSWHRDSAFLTIKYSPSGMELWRRDYVGPGGEDVPRAIAVDGQGDVWITGTSLGASGTTDFATVKYSSGGEELFVVRQDGEAGGDDAAVGLALDSTGAAYVSGSSRNEAGDRDYLTVKYSSGGAEVWARRHAGSGGGDDTPRAVIVAGDDVVRVVGTAREPDSLDIAIVAHGAEGQDVWTAVYGSELSPSERGSMNIARDSLGNLVVTGETMTVKFSPEGELLWAVQQRREIDPYVFRVDVDLTGSVYRLSGRSIWLWLWRSFFPHPGRLEKYSANGTLLWDLPVPEDVAWSTMELAPGGGLYLAGETVDPGGGSDYLVAKYDPDGGLLWQVTHGVSGRRDAAAAITVDAEGSVYVTGATDGLSDQSRPSQATTVKFDSDGNRQWVARYDMTPEFGVEAAIGGVALTLGADGSLYVGGNDDGCCPSEGFLVKYDAEGQTEWTDTFDSPPPSDDPVHLFTSPEGDILLVWNKLGRKYTPSGSILWETTLPLRAFRAVEADGNVYITDSGSMSTAKVDADGNTAWVQTYEGPVGDDRAADLAVDTGGNVFVAGSSGSQRGDADLVLIKYSPGAAGLRFLRADGNDDGLVDISDAVFNLEVQFLGEHEPGCLAALDTNADGAMDISDPIYNLEHQFLGKSAPPAPYPTCGPESLPPGEALPCETPRENCP